MAQEMKHTMGERFNICFNGKNQPRISWRKIDILIPKLQGNGFIRQKRSSRLDCRATESWLFSFIKLIWRIFISVRERTLTVNKYVFFIVLENP
jgi:hypothetical protein